MNDTLLIILSAIIIIISFIAFMPPDTMDHFTRIEPRRQRLNNERGTYGQFLVQCEKCGRDRDLIKNTYTCSEFGYCLDKCVDGIHNDTVSLYSDEYVDTDQIYCYNCLLDNNTKKFYRNFMNFPYSNGPPQTNVFTY